MTPLTTLLLTVALLFGSAPQQTTQSNKCAYICHSDGRIVLCYYKCQ